MRYDDAEELGIHPGRMIAIDIENAFVLQLFARLTRNLGIGGVPWKDTLAIARPRGFTIFYRTDRRLPLGKLMNGVYVYELYSDQPVATMPPQLETFLAGEEREYV